MQKTTSNTLCPIFTRLRTAPLKGFRTDLYKTKKKIVEATYPFKIVEN